MNPAVLVVMIMGLFCIALGVVSHLFGDTFNRLSRRNSEILFGERLTSRLMKATESGGMQAFAETIFFIAGGVLLLVGFLAWIGVLNAIR